MSQTKESPEATPEPAGDEVESHKMPLIEHLLELRRRLLYSMVALGVAFIGCYVVAEQIYNFLARPLGEIFDRPMIYTGLHEFFFVQLKVALFGAFCLAFPILAGQLWAFIAPGLYRHEKRAFLPFLFATPVLFLLGAALVYYLIIPMAWRFFLSFETTGTPGVPAVELQPKVDEYLSLVMKLILAFGVSFQLPVLLTLMARVGLVNSAGLAAKRKYAVVVVFLVAAFLTPPDIISQIGLALPILLLYELSILSIRLVERRQAAEAARAAGH